MRCGRARRVGRPGQGPQNRAWEISWARHRSRRLVLALLVLGVVAMAAVAGLIMQKVPHGAGFASGFCAGIILGGGVGIVAWVQLGSDGSMSWRLGALGEEFSWGQLRRLGRAWTVLHDLSLPGADGTSRELDHVAVGPAGVFVIDSKLRTGDEENLNRLSTSFERCIRGVERQAGVLRYHLNRHPSTGAASAGVVPTLMVWGPDVASADEGVRVTSNGVWIVHGRDAELWRRRIHELPKSLSSDLQAQVVDSLKPFCPQRGSWARLRSALGKGQLAGSESARRDQRLTRDSRARVRVQRDSRRFRSSSAP